MSKTIDQRVVEMRFDNKQFENNVKTSLSTLDKLKQSLRLDGAAKGFEELERAAGNVDLSGIGGAIETVRTKFSAFEVMAVTALANITNSAINTGKQLVASLTVDQITEGWEKFSDKTRSVGTLISQGFDLNDVTEQLSRLNWFTDETSYNFTEMVSNISKFTATGKGLEESVTAMEGIANWAALSGQNAATASHAMYQLSQAMGAGVMRLEDYKSIQNASMDTDEFRQKCLDAGVALGTLRKNADGTYHSLVVGTEDFSKSQFATHLTEEAWLTSDVMMKVFNDYSAAVDQIYDYADEKGITASQAIEELGDSVDAFGLKAFKAAQEARTWEDAVDSVKDAVSTGWMNTFENIFGNYEEAKNLWTDLANAMYDVFASGAETRNELLSAGLGSGWSKFLKEGISDAEGYKDAIIGVARSQGIAIDDIIESTGSFESALHEGWLTSDILAEALNNLTEKTAGLSEEELANAGYSQRQLESLKELNEAVKSGSIDLDEYTESITRLSGRENLLEAFWNTWNAVFGDGEEYLGIIGTIKEAFRDIFPATTVEQLYNFTVKLKELTEKFKMSEETSENLKNTFKGLFAVLDIVKQVFGGIFTAIKPLLGQFDTLGGGVLGFTGNLGKAIVKFDEFLKSSGALQKAGERIASVFEGIGKVFKAFKEKIKEKLDSVSLEGFHTLLGKIHERMSQVGDALGSMKSGVTIAISAINDALSKCKFLQLLEALWNAVKRITSGVVKALGNMAGKLVSALGNANFTGIIDLLNGLSIGGIAVGIVKFLKSVREPIEGFSSFLEELKSGTLEILDGLRGCLEAYQQNLKAGTLLKIAIAVGILAASLLTISLIDSKKMAESLVGITVLFGDLMGAMAIFSKIGGKGLKKNATMMIAMAAAVLILANALKKVAELDLKQVGVGLLGIAGLSAILVVVAKALSTNSKAVIKGSVQMVIFAAAIKILAGVCEQLSQLEWDQLARGLAGVGVLLAEVALFLRTAKFGGKAITTATGMVILAAALKILASVCKDFSVMNWNQIGIGLAAIGALLAEVMIFTKLSGSAKHVISTGIALTIIGAAMKIFASAVRDFSQMEWDQISRGLQAMAGALLAVTLAVNFMPKNMIGIGTGLVIVSAAMLILANVLGKLGDMNEEQIANGLIAFGGAIGILAIGLNAMTGTLAGSAALLVAAAALLILTPVLSILGAMSWESIVKGLVALAGAFTILGVAGAVLSPLVPSILGLSGSLALVGVAIIGIGAGLILAGAGLSALAVGLTALAAAGTAGATAIVAALTVIIVGVIDLIPTLAAKLGESIIVFCQVIAASVDAIGEAVKDIVLVLLDVLIECIPPIVDGALLLVDEICKAIVRYTPSVVDSIFQFLVAVLEGIAANLPSLIQAGIDVIMAFFTGVVEAFKSIDTDILMEGIVGVGILSAVMAALTAVALLVPGAMIGVLGMGAVIAELALVLAAVGAISLLPGLHWLIGKGGDLLQSVGTAIGKFAGGIVGGFASGVSASFIDIADDLSEFMARVQPFLEGAAAIDPAMLDGIKALTEAILLLTAANLIDSLTSWFTGGVSLAEFADQLVPFGQAMKAFSNEVTGIDGEAITKASDAGKTLAEMADMLPKSGGLVGWFSGETDMEKFGQQLVRFGRSMREYSYAVAGLQTEAIESSATAGEALVELASTLPNTGGLVSWFTGEQDLGKFGRRLVPFGRSMREYSAAVVGLNGNVVINSANAAKALVELADNLPNSGGIISWFTGESDMEAFGRQLVSFGEALFAYYNKVSWIDTVKLKDTTEEFRGLMRLFDEIGDLRTNGVSQFSRSLTALAETGIENFVGAFADAENKIEAAGQSMVQFFKNGADSKTEETRQSFVTLAGEALSSLRSKLTEFTASGEAFIENLILGAKGKLLSLKEAFGELTDACVRLIREKRPSFYSAGEYLVKGFAQGIDETRWEAEAKAKGMAKAAAQAAAEELQIHSPSKVGYRIGGFFGLGFIKSLADYSERSYDAGASVAASAKNGLRETIAKIGEFIDSGMDTQPTIRPVLDLSSVQRSSGQLSALLSGNRAVAINAAVEEERTRNIQNGESKAASSNSYSFVQNNYSPKPLSRIEIYRQTKNQFSALKGLVEV